MKAPSPRPAYEVDLATLGSRDFHFGTRHHASIHPIAFLRSFGFGFSSLGAVFASPRRSFRLPQKPKTGKLRIFSTFHKHLSEPHLPGRIISPLPVAFLYPLATASAPIRRTMLPNSRRVRWPSASVSQ